jgi:hypothetical protein
MQNLTYTNSSNFLMIEMRSTNEYNMFISNLSCSFLHAIFLILIRMLVAFTNMRW